MKGWRHVCVCIGGLGQAAGSEEASQEKLSSAVHRPKVAAHVVLGECDTPLHSPAARHRMNTNTSGWVVDTDHTGGQRSLL